MRMSFLKRRLFGVVLVMLPILTALFCLGVGRIAYTPGQVASGLWNIALHGRDAVDSQTYSVLINIRLPRVLLATLCGSGMALAGCAFQSLFSNVMATPDTLGVAAGASFGAALALLFGWGLVAVQFSALTMGVIAVAVTIGISARRDGASTVMIILSGIIVSSLFQAFVSLIKYVADPDSKLPAITYWLLGSLVSRNRAWTLKIS